MTELEDDGIPVGTEGTFTVIYAVSDEGLRIPDARFALACCEEHGVVPIILIGEKEAVILDPRALVFNDTTHKVDYSPRYWHDEQLPWVKEWLRLHPWWAIPGCENDWVKARRGVE
jgi:hypothetical protein